MFHLILKHSLVFHLAKKSDQNEPCTGLVMASDRAEDKYSIALTSSLMNFPDDFKVFVSTINLSDNQLKLSNQTEIANFKSLYEAQADKLINDDFLRAVFGKIRPSAQS